MSSLRKEIEAKVLAKLRGILGAKASVTGFLESVAAGTVKNVAAGKPEVRVTVAPGQAGGWGLPEMEFAVSVNVRLDLEDDATQALFDEVCEPIESLVLSWQLDRNWLGVSEDLGVPGFRIDGFRAGGGSDSISLTSTDPYVSTNFMFTLQGTILQTT